MENLNTQIDNIMLSNNELQCKHGVLAHNPAVVNEIHLFPKQHAPKTISKVGPRAPGARGGAGGRAGGPSGPEVVKC